jgi:hypothetical protein
MPKTASNTSGKDSKYKALLQLPQWQKKRLEVLEAAGWKCSECGAEDRQLQIHHKRYIAGAKPWEYESDDLAVLCDRCHEKEHGTSAPRQPKSPRRRPTTGATLLRLVMQRPALIARIPLEAVPADTPEGRALAGIAAKFGDGKAPFPGGASDLLEHFRGTDHEGALSDAAESAVEDEFDDVGAKGLIEDTVRKVESDKIGNQIADLLQKDREGGMDEEDRTRLSSLLVLKRQIAQKAKADAARAEGREAADRAAVSDELILTALNELRAMKGLPPSRSF